MFKSIKPSYLLALFIIFIWAFICFACTPKKASSNYGDNKTYADEDSSGEIKSIEKNAKMPFDTSSLPIVPKR